MQLMVLLVAIALLVIGAEGLVRGASEVAEWLGVPQVFIGLTIVAFGTSAPELAVSVRATAMGEFGVAVGNVVGSNIFNVLVILGIASAIVPMKVTARTVRTDVPVMIGISLLLVMLTLDGQLSRAEGGLLVAVFVAHVGVITVLARREVGVSAEVEDIEWRPRAKRWLKSLLLI